jgi:hypothetical protein
MTIGSSSDGFETTTTQSDDRPFLDRSFSDNYAFTIHALPLQ